MIDPWTIDFCDYNYTIKRIGSDKYGALYRATVEEFPELFVDGNHWSVVLEELGEEVFKRLENARDTNEHIIPPANRGEWHECT